FIGKAKYQRPNLVLLELHKKYRPQVYEKVVSTGSRLFWFVPDSKVINAYELPMNRVGVFPGVNKFMETLVSLFFGMNSEEAAQRYELTLVKEDQHYAYIEFVPKRAADKATFVKARLVLNARTWLPRQIWYECVNGTELTWDLPKIIIDAAIPREDFA